MKIIEHYNSFKDAFRKNPLDISVTDALFEICAESKKLILSLDRKALKSINLNKNYFSFSINGRISRAVNNDLFENEDVCEIKLLNCILNRDFTSMSVDEITKACYCIAISFACSIDILKDNDQKTPGTFFECFIGHLFATRFNVIPFNEIDVLNLDMKTKLTTDFIFDLGPSRPKYHVPVKTSTRERVIQVWAHQRILDGIYGQDRFLGLLTCLSETKVDQKRFEVVEICLPDQWKVYQLFIAKMSSIYYLDVPARYESLSKEYPPIHVQKIGEFFKTNL